MITTPHKNDHHVQLLHDTLGAPGQSGFDLLAQSPGRGTRRTYEGGRSSGKEFKEFSVPEGWVLAGGCCVALCKDGLVRPAVPEYDLDRILGFCHQAMDRDRASIRISGSILLTVDGVTEHSNGKSVFCTSPDSFTVDTSAGGLLLGEVDYVQDGKTLVRFGDSHESRKDFYRVPSRAHY